MITNLPRDFTTYIFIGITTVVLAIVSIFEERNRENSNVEMTETETVGGKKTKNKIKM
jgi:hypothetical protein